MTFVKGAVVWSVGTKGSLVPTYEAVQRALALSGSKLLYIGQRGQAAAGRPRVM